MRGYTGLTLALLEKPKGTALGQEQEIKIRTLPRKNEKVVPSAKSEQPKKQADSSSRWIIYLGAVSSVALFGLVFTAKTGGPTKRAATAVAAAPAAKAAVMSQDLSSVGTAADDLVNRHLQEAAMKREMMEQTRMLENMNVQPVAVDADTYVPPQEERPLGVQLDEEHTMEEIYKDINGSGAGYADFLPHDRINNRLANRRWVNEQERAERITFVRNFLKAAYDRGYEVQLDQNLVVVGVRRINRTEKLDIDQIIDRLAKQGI